MKKDKSTETEFCVGDLITYPYTFEDRTQYCMGLVIRKHEKTNDDLQIELKFGIIRPQLYDVFWIKRGSEKLSGNFVSLPHARKINE